MGVIKENGHFWSENSNRCSNCQMKFGYYLNIKHASEKQPEREDLKKWMQCSKPREETQ